MSATIGWGDIALRLACTLIAGALVGFDRLERGRPAGLRTTILVSLAACAAMIEANLLVSTVGKAADSFVNIDPMRLPLGILSGMGFIGAGAIIRRDNMLLGVTTAATLWFATVVGLVFGAGYFALAFAALGLGLFVLIGLRWVEPYVRQDHRAVLTLEAGPEATIDEGDVRACLHDGGYRLTSTAIAFIDGAKHREYRWDVAWVAGGAEVRPPGFIGELARRPGVLRVAWTPELSAEPRGAPP